MGGIRKRLRRVGSSGPGTPRGCSRSVFWVACSSCVCVLCGVVRALIMDRHCNAMLARASHIKLIPTTHTPSSMEQGYLTAPLIADYARNIRAAAFDARYPRCVTQTNMYEHRSRP